MPWGKEENITRFHILLCLSAIVHNNVTFDFDSNYPKILIFTFLSVAWSSSKTFSKGQLLKQKSKNG